MFDHALGHHGGDPHACTARPKYNDALLGEAVRGPPLHLQGSIDSCQGCCCCALMQHNHSQYFVSGAIEQIKQLSCSPAGDQCLVEMLCVESCWGSEVMVTAFGAHCREKDLRVSFLLKPYIVKMQGYCCSPDVYVKQVPNNEALIH